MNPTCPYCSAKAEQIDSKEIYGRSYGLIWICRPCDAYVGARRDGRPKGRLAKPELRKLRRKFHNVFDRLWTTGKERKKLYSLLAVRLDMEAHEVHGGQLTEETAPGVIAEVIRLRDERFEAKAK